MGCYMIRDRPREPHYDEVHGTHREMTCGPSKEFETGEINEEDF